MDISGSYRFDAPPDRVWNLLMDPVVIASCIPGCQELAPDGEDRYLAKLSVALSAITGTYDGTVVISEKTPPTSYRLTVDGQGKPGFVKGSAAIALRADGASHRRGRQRHGANRRSDCPPRAAPHRRRGQDDAGSVLREPAGQSLGPVRQPFQRPGRFQRSRIFWNRGWARIRFHSGSVGIQKCRAPGCPAALSSHSNALSSSPSPTYTAAIATPLT